jgi:hypothetical protein
MEIGCCSMKKKSRALCTIRICEVDDLARLEEARTVVRGLEGVTTAEADHVLQILTVEYDPDRIELNEIRNAVKKMGKS